MENKIRFTKSSITFSDQVNLLEQRGLLVPSKQLAEFYLQHISYYRFTTYCLPYEENHSTHQFKPGTKFEDILNLYIFDREFRLLLLDAIERIEISLRTQLAHWLSRHYKSSHPHLNKELFKNSNIYDTSISNLRFSVKNSNEDFIKHFTRKYEEPLPPIWAVVELTTIGELSKWFRNIKARNVRKIICKQYKLDEVVKASFFEHISLFEKNL